MCSTTLIHGFQLSSATLDAFLSANGVDETYGSPPFYYHHPDKCPISRLLFSKITQHDPAADKNRFRVLLPSVEDMGTSKTAFVANAWAVVFALREVRLDEDLPGEVPKGFGELREEILGFGKDVKEEDKIPEEGKMGVYLVVTEDINGEYRDEVYKEGVYR